MQTALLLNWAVILGVVLSASLATPVAQANAVPDEVQAAAESGLPIFLKAIPANEFARYGFTSEQEVTQATLGEPYRVFIIAPEALNAYQPDVRLAALLTATNLWYFPVVVAGVPRTLLTVDRLNGQWQAVAIGGLDLPRHLAQGKRGLPSLMATDVPEPYTTKLVRVPQAQAEFMAVESAQRDYLMPVMTRPQSLKVENLQLYPADEIIARLIPVVKKNIQIDRLSTNVTFGSGSSSDSVTQTEIEPPSATYSLVLLTLSVCGIALLVVRKRRRSPSPDQDRVRTRRLC